MKQHRIILSILMLMATSFMSFKPYVDDPRSPIIMQVVGIILLAYSLNTIFCQQSNDNVFKAGSVWVLCSFFMGMLSSYILYDQGFYQSLKAISPWIFCVCLYFLCIKWR